MKYSLLFVRICGTTGSPSLCAGSISSRSFAWKLWFAFGERKGVKYLSAPPKSSWWTRRQSQPVSPSIGAA